MATKTQRARKMQRRRWHNRTRPQEGQIAMENFLDLLAQESKTQLLTRASGLNIRGRSKMTMGQLIDAIMEHTS